MKQYPSILSSNGSNFTDFTAYVFDKIDGSNLRFEWSRKRGWYKCGTRTRLFDQTDADFGEAIPLFQDTFASDLEKIAKTNRWDSLIVYTEFWGESSFAGHHEKEEPKNLTLFDAVADKKGIMGPKDFLSVFGQLNVPRFLGIHHWTRGFVEKIRKGELDGVTFEGVIGKSGEGHNLLMRKAKTQEWLDAVKGKYGEEAINLV